MSANDALDKDQGGLLSGATLLALQLHHQPFSSQLLDASAHLDDDAGTPPPPFSDAVTEEQLADIKQALITGDDLLLILGEKGSGKTTLAQQLNDNSGLRIQCFSVTGSDNFSTLNLFAGMLEAFSRNPPQQLKDILDELTPCLQSMAARNTLSVIVLDDAHKVNRAELTQLLSGMLYMNSQDETLMRVALAAVGEFEDVIPDLLPEGADMPYSSLTIEGFSPPRAAAYLDYRLGLAGFDQEFPFTDRDMASLVDHSDGRPGQLHALTADVLNEKYGRLEDKIPQELLSNNDEGFLSSRKSKLALGALATVLILGGLLAFLPQGENQDRGTSGERIDVATRDVATQAQAPELKLINTEQSEPSASIENAEESSTDTTATQSEEPESTGPTVAPDNSDDAPESDTNSSSNSTDTAETSATTIVELDESDSTQELDSSSNNESSSELTENVQSNADELAINAESDTDETVASITNSSNELATDEDPQTDQNESPEPPAEDQETTDTASSDNTSSPPQTDTDDTESVSSIDPEIEDLLESPTWILVQDENQFTIQMSASRDLPSVENFLRRNTLPGPNSIFSFERNGEVWYALVHGIFPTFSDAQREVEAMPASAQRDTPWIRSIARVKEILRQE